MSVANNPRGLLTFKTIVMVITVVFSLAYAGVRTQHTALRTPHEALVYCGCATGINVAAVMIPIMRLLKDLKSRAPLYKVIALQLAIRVPVAIAAITLAAFNEWAADHFYLSLDRYLENWPEAFVYSFIGAIFISVWVAFFTVGVQKKQRDVSRTNHSAEAGL